MAARTEGREMEFWSGLDGMASGDVERFRESIERFAEAIIDKVRS